MKNFEDIKLYLPKYLSESSINELIENLKNFPQNISKDSNIKAFPDNISSSIYNSLLWYKETIFQGDGLKDFLVVNLPEEKIGKAPCIILSNTCDTDLNNKRGFPAQICYAPIFDLEKYKQKLIETKVKTIEATEQHIQSIKNQYVTQMLYLPIGGALSYEGIVFLDRINHCDNKSILRDNITERRLFMFSNYGFYLLLIKISIHFTRMQEQQDRNI